MKYLLQTSRLCFHRAPDFRASGDVPNSSQFDASLNFDMRPDEPEMIRDRCGNPIENKSDDVRSMTREQFQQHICRMFTKHYEMAGIVRKRKCVGRGRCGKPRYKFFKEKVSREHKNLTSLMETGGINFQGLLEDITNDVFNNPEYQRGTANYLKAYQLAWEYYTDAMQQVEHSACSNDPVFKSSTIRTGRAPGAYSNGELLQASGIYAPRRKRPRSDYAKKWLREKVGVDPDPARTRAQKEACRIKIGYGRAWKRNITKRLWKEYARGERGQNPPTAADVSAEIDRLVACKLEAQGMLKDYVRPDLRPPPPPPPKDSGRLEANVDLRYREQVALSLVSTLKQGDIALGITPTARSKSGLRKNRRGGNTPLEQLDAAVTFNEVQPGKDFAGFPAIVEYKVDNENVRGKPVDAEGQDLENIERGLVLIEQSDDKPNESLSRVIRYSEVRDMMNTHRKLRGSPHMKQLLAGSKYFNQNERNVLTNLSSNTAYFDTATYFNLVANLKSDSQPFALDDLINLYENLHEPACVLVEDLDTYDAAATEGEKVADIFSWNGIAPNPAGYDTLINVLKPDAKSRAGQWNLALTALVPSSSARKQILKSLEIDV